MLCCLDGAKNQTIGLVLTPCYSPADPTRPLYHTAWRRRMWRTVLLGESFARPRLFGDHVSPEWRDIYIAAQPPPPPASVLCTPSDYTLSPPFRFPMQELETCLGQYGTLAEVSQESFGWAGYPPVVFKFQHVFVFATIYVAFGRCSLVSSRSRRGDRPPSLTQPGLHWASVLFEAGRVQSSAADMAPQHDCAKDHVADWPERSRLFTGKFKNGDILLTLSFREDPLSPAETFVPHIKHDVQVRSMVGPGVIAWQSDSDHVCEASLRSAMVMANTHIADLATQSSYYTFIDIGPPGRPGHRRPRPSR